MLVSRKSSEKGFSLVELVITITLIAIIGYVATSLYLEVVQAHRREQRILQVERSLLNVHNSLEQSLVTLPGRSLAVTSQGFSIPILPNAGNTFNPVTGKNEPIQLGLITPYKINGSDAFMVVYADSQLPRGVLSQATTTISGDKGVAKVVIPAVTNETNFDENSDGNGKLESKSLSSKTYQVGDLMLLIGTPPTAITKNGDLGEVQSFARIVKVTNISNPINSKIGSLNQNYISFTYDLCLSGECDSRLPGLFNLSTTPTSFGIGSILIPIKTACFYLKTDAMGNRLMRNDDGVILPNGDGTFKAVAGKESILGEIDSFTVKYILNNGVIQNTPPSPRVDWLKEIKSIDISLTRNMPSLKGSEDLTRTVNANFPLVIKHLE